MLSVYTCPYIVCITCYYPTYVNNLDRGVGPHEFSSPALLPFICVPFDRPVPCLPPPPGTPHTDNKLICSVAFMRRSLSPHSPCVRRFGLAAASDVSRQVIDLSRLL